MTSQRHIGRPRDIGKGVEHATPIGPITPAARVPGIASAPIRVNVNDPVRQKSTVGSLIWNIAEIIEPILRRRGHRHQRGRCFCLTEGEELTR